VIGSNSRALDVVEHVVEHDEVGGADCRTAGGNGGRGGAGYVRFVDGSWGEAYWISTSHMSLQSEWRSSLRSSRYTDFISENFKSKGPSYLEGPAYPGPYYTL